MKCIETDNTWVSLTKCDKEEHTMQRQAYNYPGPDTVTNT